MQKNKEVILEHFDIREGAALHVALNMGSVGIGEIRGFSVTLDDEYIKEFTMVDKSGQAYCIVMNGRGSLTYIFKDRLGGEALYDLPPE